MKATKRMPQMEVVATMIRRSMATFSPYGAGGSSAFAALLVEIR
jgi:hypothetical protein